MATTSIEWTATDGIAGMTWNPVTGCTRVSAGCDNCYAAQMTHRLEHMGEAKYRGLTVLNARGERHFNGVVRTHDDALRIPLKWRKPRRVFVNSMSDLFHRDVPFEFIDQVFAVMALCPQHTFMVLTKRPERMAEYLNDPAVQHRIAKAMDAISVQREMDALPEAWKPVGGYPGYEVSNHGRVRGPRGLLTPDIGEQGHSRVTLHGPAGVRGRVLVHRLVLRVWRDEARSDDVQVRHRNGDPRCNALPNLLAGTQADNWTDAKRHGSHRRYSKLSPHDVATIRDRAGKGEAAYSIAKDYPVSDTQIRNILTGTQWSTDAGIEWPLPGVWLGTSVEDQNAANARIPHLLNVPAAVRFLSCEPLLGPVDLSEWLEWGGKGPPWLESPSDHPEDQGPHNSGAWIIVGGESGAGARPCDLDWIRDLRDQCKASGVAFFNKQLGSSNRCEHSPKGGCMDCMPDDLRIREFPEVK